MSLMESLIAGIGTEVAKYSLKMWLKDNSTASDITKSITDIISKNVTDYREQRAAGRQFEAIADRAGESIYQMLQKEAGTVPDSQLEFIANAASQVIAQTEISAELLAQNNLDPGLLTELFLKKSGADGGNPSLAYSNDNTEQEIYIRLLNYASQMIVDTSSQFPLFSERVFRELLIKQDQLILIAERVMDGMNNIIASQEGPNLADKRFESDYRMAVIRRLDHLELFGVDLQKCNKRYQLSVAYVTLNVEREVVTSNSSSVELNDNENFKDRESISVNDILASTKRLLVRGSAGSGKTTLLQWISVFSSGRNLKNNLEFLNECIPFPIKLREFSDNPLPSLEEFPKVVSPSIGGQPDNWVHRILDAGLGIILIDGIDEAPEKKRNEIKQWLDDLISQYPKSRYVVTSRPHAVQEGWLDAEDFVDATLQDMKREDIYTFIDHWHEAIYEGTVDDSVERVKLESLAESLKEKLRLNPSLYRLANSPLLCAILCALHRDRVENLPSDRIELYKACIEMFFRRDPERKVSMVDYINLTDRQKQDLLQDFAWWMIRNGKSSAKQEDTDQRFDLGLSRLTRLPERSNGSEVRRLFVERVGILRQFTSEKIDFPHRTFQEYLAACEAHTENDIGELINHAKEDQWREVAILAAGIIKEADKVENYISSLLHRGEEEEAYRYTYYLIAASALETVVRLPDNSKIADEISKRLHMIVPPKTIRNAKDLSAAGELVVPLLKYNSKWNADQLATSARTLAIIGSDSSCEAICEYAIDNRVTVLSELQKSLGILSENHSAKLVNVSNLNIRKRLRHITPTRIYIENCFLISNLDFIGDLDDYEEVQFTKCHMLYDLNALSGNDSLKQITFFESKELQDLSPLQKCSSLRELTFHNSTSLKNLNGLVKHSTLQSITLFSCDNLVNVSGLGSCPALQSINISDCYQLVNVNGLGNCATIQSIKISNCQNLLDINDLGNCNTIQTITIEDCHKLEEVSSLGACTNIRSINISYCHILADVSGLGNCTSLQLVIICRCRFLEDVSGLGNCKTIQSIELRECLYLTDVSGLGNCASLQSINIFYCENLTNVNGLGNSDSLQSISVSHCEQLNEVSELGNCASLHSLSLSDCSQLTDVSSLGNCASLQKLDLSGCNQLTDVSSLGNCASLQKLDLSGCKQLTDVNSLGNCASLQKLDLSGCKQLTDVNSLGNCASLQSLSLSDCGQLADVSGLGNCVSLQELDLSGCSQLTDVNGLGNCTTLQSLELFGCDQLTNINDLEKCISLKSINISNTNIKKENIKYLQKKLPELKIESIPF